MANTEMINDFKVAWSTLDPNATGNIHVANLAELLFALGDPLGWDDSYRDNEKK